MRFTATPGAAGTSSPPKQLPVPCRQPQRPSSYGQTVVGSVTHPPHFSLASALLLGAAATLAYAMPTAPPYAPPPSASFSGAGRWSNAPPPPYPPPPPPTGCPAPNAPNTTAGQAPISGKQRGKRKQRFLGVRPAFGRIVRSAPRRSRAGSVRQRATRLSRSCCRRTKASTRRSTSSVGTKSV